MTYVCPVCAYDKLNQPPIDHLICPSCGTHFDYDDAAETHWGQVRRQAELRQAWIDAGRPWFSRATPAPDLLGQAERLVGGLCNCRDTAKFGHREDCLTMRVAAALRGEAGAPPKGQ